MKKNNLKILLYLSLISLIPAMGFLFCSIVIWNFDISALHKSLLIDPNDNITPDQILENTNLVYNIIATAKTALVTFGLVAFFTIFYNIAIIAIMYIRFIRKES